MVLYVDGGCSGNDTKDMAARRMVMVVTDEVGHVLCERSGIGGSNNIAELEAVLDALNWCAQHGQRAVEIRTDSRNNLSWVNGRKVGKAINDRGRVLALKATIQDLRSRVVFDLVWVPREENRAGHYIEGAYGL